MCFRIFCILFATLLFGLPSGFCDEERPAAVPSPPPLSRAGLGALEHASKVIVAINTLDWKTVEASVSPKDIHLTLLKRDASAQKDWHGIGAYRGFEFDTERHTLRLRFAYGSSRTTPHEVWLNYIITGDQFKFDYLTILGW